MPITLNNSNISVQYNTGSNYIIETVKSDLYVRDTVGTTSNLFAEPTVSPTVTSNIGVFTHSGGTENQTPHTIYFPVNTTCDILMIAGGGGGGAGHGGGGGAGQLILIKDAVLNGNYTIMVGNGGIGGVSTERPSSYPPNKGFNSTFGTVIAEGGGASTNISTDKNGGSGAGGDAYTPDGGTAGFGVKDNNLDTFSSGIVYSRGNDGGSNVGHPGTGGGGGGAGAAGNGNVGGNGLSGITEINYDFLQNFGSSVGQYISAENKVYFAGGGGGGATSINNVSKGGGGIGSGTTAGVAGGSALPNTGSGGGGGAGGSGGGGRGGSGIVIIKVISPTTNKYLFFNYLSTQTNYTLTFPVRTLVDVNNNNNLILQGQYNVSLGTTNSSIIPSVFNTSNRLIPLPNTSTSNISVRYHLLNPIKTTEGAQWTYSSNNPNVYHLGSVGIGTTSPEYSLDVRGFIYSSSGGYTSSALTKWSVLSDRRIKENIVKASYDKCLENVKNIELYNFNFKDNYVNTNDRHQLGFIAQEVQQVYPKAVEVSRMIMNLEEKIDDLLTLNTTQIDYTLYGAVKCLIQKLENIKIKMEQIKTVYNITT